MTAYQTSGAFVLKAIAGEDVLVPVRGARGLPSFHVLNPTAATVWRLLDGKRSVEAIAAAIAESYEVEPAAAERDVRALLARLAAIGAVIG